MTPLYYFFSGKGGVGKTTLASATAVHLARSGMKVLISSTDPAHSLSDVFDRKIGHKGVEIEKNLYALETDSSVRWREAAGGSGSMDPSEPGRARDGRGSGKRRIFSELMEALGEAPGVDEFVSLEILLETINSPDFDTVIFDTAPTGHALRLLLLPEMLDGWVGKLLVLKEGLGKVSRAVKKFFGGEGSPGDIGDGLMEARKMIKEAGRVLTDGERTLFALVTIPEAMSVLESGRTMNQLKLHGIPLGVVLVNGVQPRSDCCGFCNARHEIHQKELNRIREIAGDVPLRIIETKPEVIRGVDALALLGASLWGGVGSGSAVSHFASGSNHS